MRPGAGLSAGNDWKHRALLAAAAIVFACSTAGASAATDEEKVYTVGNYPVEARAANAVAAKEKAVADGQQAAFRSLLKRLVPVGSYNRLTPLRSVKAGDLISSFAVRSERNSTTEYIASYDFSFQPEAVRALLDREGIPYADRQAEVLTVVPVYRPPPAAAGASRAFTERQGSDTWLYAWKALDLANSLTPVTLQPFDAGPGKAEAVNAVLGGDIAAARGLAPQSRTGLVVVAVLEPDSTGKKVNVTMAGRDAAGGFRLARAYRLDGDLTYTSELAALISLGIIEGRWKAISVRGGGHFATAGPSGADAFRIAVQFGNMAEWQEISHHLSATPEVSDLEVEGLSARGARLALRYPGGPERLASALANQGLTLRNAGGTWVLSSR